MLGVFAPWQDSYSLDHPPFHAVVCLFVWPLISDLVGLCRRVLSVGRKRESDSIVTLEVSKFELSWFVAAVSLLPDLFGCMFALALVGYLAFGSRLPTGRCSSQWHYPKLKNLKAAQTRRCSLLLASPTFRSMPAPKAKSGVQRIPLTSDGSDTDADVDTETEPCDKALPMDIDRVPASEGLSQGRFPADTPITPPVFGVSHQQFCNAVKGRELPGDGSGRGSFDTFPTLRLVIRKPDLTHILL